MNVREEWWENFFHGVALDLWRGAVTAEQTRVEADFIEAMLRVSPVAEILDVPCGNGRLSLELAARGYSLTGVDFAADFIEEARAGAVERNLKVAFEHKDMRDLPLAARFDGAFCFGNSFGYMTDEGNADFVKAVGRALKPGARFVIDTHNIAETTLLKFKQRQWFEIGDITLLIENRYDHVTSRLHTDYTFMRGGQTDKRPSSQRLYTYGELCRLLEEAGFTECEGYGLLDQEPFDMNSDRLLMVATRKGD
ncbi:MAG TPA: methyltransferase domain-containing protein [Pyrinomonadaceae bacterium]|jgi:SAM-dependent methyltransferase|nr:methyltransferase domain-containing protein [Pyrinomonadaceae bacterium]